jgi:hypothetical protein
LGLTPDSIESLAEPLFNKSLSLFSSHIFKLHANCILPFQTTPEINVTHESLIKDYSLKRGRPTKQEMPPKLSAGRPPQHI